MADTGDLAQQLEAARPDAEDQLLEALVAGRLFGHQHLAAAKIDRFTLLERIGRGGTGDVFAAYDPVLDRKVALKVLHGDAGLGRLEADEREWLLREARAAARLSHPNVVAIYEVGEFGDGIFAAMEHIDGVTLRAWLREPRPHAAILEVFVQAGRGLAAAHEAGLIHRDFKPENVLVCGDRLELRARVVDFGLARTIDRRRLGDDRPDGGVLLSTKMGTPAYMAPEQLRGRALDPRSDQFGFCVALCEALTGRHPFGADRPGATSEQLLARIVDGRRPLGERALPSWLRRIVRRGLAVDPADRWPSMRALVRTLEATPARRRRRWVVALGLALAIGSSALTIASLDEDAGRDHCVELEAELQDVWDPAVREAARSAFSQAGLVNADEVWERLEPRIDDYASAWIASREQSCHGRLGAMTLSPEHAALREACLDRRRAELGGLTELLRSPDQATVLAALDAVDQLTPISSCDELESLRREASLADAVDDPDAVESLRREILRRISQARAGHARQLGSTADRLLDRARTLAAPGLLAEALFLRALIDEAEGDYHGAAATLEAAVLEAIAARHDRLHAQIAVRLVWLHGERRREPAIARGWADRADAAIRASRGDLVLRARLLDHQGVIAIRDHDYRGAERLHREALAICRELAPQAAGELAASTSNLGASLVLQGKVDEAAPLIEEALLRYRERFGPNHPDVAAVLSNLGDAHVQIGELERGLELLHEALALKQRVFGPDHVALLTTLDHLGNAYAQLGRNDEAQAAYQRGLEIGERELGPDRPELEPLLHNLAYGSWLLGDHQAVIRHAERALVLQRTLYGEQHPILALTYELLARGQLGVGDPRSAHATIELALGLARPGQLGSLERGNLLLSAAWIERANGAPSARVRALASEARELLGDAADPLAARELTELLGSSPL